MVIVIYIKDGVSHSVPLEPHRLSVVRSAEDAGSAGHVVEPSLAASWSFSANALRRRSGQWRRRTP